MITTSTEIQAWEGEELVGKIVFELNGMQLSILHTYAYQSGRGIGTQLMQEVVRWANLHGYSILPICSFAVKYMEHQ